MSILPSSCGLPSHTGGNLSSTTPRVRRSSRPPASVPLPEQASLTQRLGNGWPCFSNFLGHTEPLCGIRQVRRWHSALLTSSQAMLKLCSTCPGSSSEKAEERARASESVRLCPGMRSPRASQHSSGDHREDHMVPAMLAVPGVAGTEQRKPSSVCFSSPLLQRRGTGNLRREDLPEKSVK